MSESANIARHLRLMAAQQPHVAALKIPRGRTSSGHIDYLSLTFAELDAEVNAWVADLHARGVAPGDRVLVMVRQGLPLIAAAFALFSHGAIPIVIDPGMGLKAFLSCVQRSHPRVVLGIPLARALSRVFRRTFGTVAVRVPASGNPLARRAQPASQGRSDSLKHDPLVRASTDLAAILFTSGSTGEPKGVCYEHGMFEAQVRLIRATYDIQPGEIDLPMLPIFALFNPALGMTTIVPEIDPRRPAAVDPAKIVQAIQQEGVTNSFGSPTLWNKMADHCIQSGTTLPSLKRVLCAGAPVPVALWQKSKRFLPIGQLHSPYGATEALPVTSVSASELLQVEGPQKTQHSPSSEKNSGAATRAATVRLSGTCVGRPVPEMQVKIIALAHGSIPTLHAASDLPPGEIGEVVVSGPVVTKHYDGLPQQTAEAKVQTLGIEGSSSAVVWHRMGDCGYLDERGYLWFCGRKVENVEAPSGVLFTEPFERVFREIPGVARCALIGVGEKPNQTPALVVQPQEGYDVPALMDDLKKRARLNVATGAIKQLFFHPNFPVDVRHNAKIHRLTLAKWAATQKPVEL